MTVYMDFVIVLNFAIDFLLLVAADRLTGYPSILWRVILAAGLGGIYGGLCMIPQLRYLGATVWRIFALLLMSSIAFGFVRSAIQRGTVFLFLSMGLGGICTAVSADNMLSLLLCTVSVLLLCRLGFHSGVGHRKYVKVTFSHKGNTLHVTALVDTGNILTDPITGEQVTVAGADTASKLLGLTEEQLRDPITTIQDLRIQGMRLIPYRSVGNPAGMLLAMKMDAVKIDGREAGRVVAFAPDCFKNCDTYQALAGGVL